MPSLPSLRMPRPLRCRQVASANHARNRPQSRRGSNEGLGEHLLCDLNDEINRLIPEKSHWECRIVELGGPNYVQHSAKMTDLEGARRMGILEKVEGPAEEDRRVFAVEEWRGVEALGRKRGKAPRKL
ncbi:hypothetical protein OIU85_001861 [Salix viminalis]|uniref:Uncharacterized protein n=1 Tax=Salix viminalis TaxID=40686 RepID=A0A9Q0VMB2_SALVM|nr:hypothetical protein OIU85_001861 [Salix viminalis]